eukprot:m.19110 g.19110  ORF g.19110 m.19110 type:complete len:549 (+) comp6486_c0_seq1:28-1674(+)
MATKMLALCSLLALTTLATARVALEDDVSLERLQQGWTSEGPASSATTFQVMFAVKQRNVDALEETLLRVSDPDSESYGKHMTMGQVKALIAPAKDSILTVKSFLRKNGVRDCETNGDIIRCVATLKQMESMLDVKMHSFRHKSNATVVRATQHYTLPEDIATHVDFVAPVNRFPSMRSLTVLKKVSGMRTNTPDSLRKLYNVGTVEGKNPKNKQACTAFLKQHFLQKDLANFYKKYYPDMEGMVPKVIGPDMGFPGVEASLDIEYISTLGAKVPTEFWSFAGTAPDNRQNEPFLDFMYLIGNTSDAEVPKVFSTSYGEAEDTVSMAYMSRIEAEFQKAGGRGITLLFASGDSGCADDNGQCKNGRFAGMWPAGSPWVTGVGGTENDTPEQAWGGSSGGFSDRWPQPTFQKEAIATFFSTATNLPDQSHYNATSRGFPDVSAQATNFEVINGGVTLPVAGTSCATPTFSGIVGLLNDLRMTGGKSPLGWMNPLLYKNPSMFTDITTGTQGSGIGCGPHGFAAVKGWDPVTGLGTADYQKMAQVIADLP